MLPNSYSKHNLRKNLQTEVEQTLSNMLKNKIKFNLLVRDFFDWFNDICVPCDGVNNIGWHFRHMPIYLWIGGGREGVVKSKSLGYVWIKDLVKKKKDKFYKHSL